MLFFEKSVTDSGTCTIVYSNLQPNYRGIWLFSHSRHTRAIPVRHGARISPYGVGPLIRGIAECSLFTALLMDVVLWTLSHLHSQLHLFHNIFDTLCCSTKYSNNANCALPRWHGRECLFECGRG